MSPRKQKSVTRADFERRLALAEQEEKEAKTRPFRMVKLQSMFGQTIYDYRIPPVVVWVVLGLLMGAMVYGFLRN